MRHEHLVVTVDSGTKARIEDDLDPGETVEAWVANAIDAKLAREEAREETKREETGSSEEIRAADDETGVSDKTDVGDEAVEDGDESKSGDDDYDEGFEYVDDCAI